MPPKKPIPLVRSRTLGGTAHVWASVIATSQHKTTGPEPVLVLTFFSPEFRRHRSRPDPASPRAPGSRPWPEVFASLSSDPIEMEELR